MNTRAKWLGLERVDFEETRLASPLPDDDLLALDEALERLERAEPEVAAVVRLRFFAGLSGVETAEALGVSARQVDRLWTYARVWLLREMAG